jgi:hypothetical protein
MYDIGPLPEHRESKESQELDAQLRKQALRCHRLANVLTVLEQYPRNGASQHRILRLALLEFSRQLQVMQRTAEKIIALSSLPIPLSTIIERATKEMEQQ